MGLATVAAATRAIHWHIGPVMIGLLYASMGLALAVFAYGVWRRVRVWRVGRPEFVFDQLGVRLRRMLFAGVAQASVLRQRVAGGAHAMLVFGFIVLFSATVIVFLQQDLGWHIMHGPLYLYYQSLTVDIFGLAVLVGVGYAIVRRYVVRAAQLEHGRRGDAFVLACLFLIALTGFALEGMRIAATRDPWGAWSPGGNAAGWVLLGIFRSRSSLADGYPGIWLFHTILWHALLAAVPFTKLTHALTAPLNLFFANPGPARGVVPRIDFTGEDVPLGIRSPLDLTWRQLFSLDACTECGRCQNSCPAFAADKPLSPKRVVLDLRDHIRANSDSIVRAHAARGEPDRSAGSGTSGELPRLAGEVITAEALWSCTTCRACEEACPVGIEHVPLIIGLRQNLAMEQGETPARVAETVGSLEARNHPFRGAAFGRTDWLEGLPVPVIKTMDEAAGLDVVYWVGCAAAFDARAQNVARALVKIMDHAGLRFGVLGGGERCCGDFARRTGNEFHYSELAAANVETLDGIRPTRLITHCPHCLQALKHEYAPWGARYDVTHHTELIRSLIRDGRLTFEKAAAERTTFHDPCYLGRYNDGYDPPRDVLDALAVDRVEMARAREKSFCCGSGGGHAFYDDGDGKKINALRVRQALETGATTIATGCPFCLTMIEDGIRSAADAQRPLRARDLAEIVADRLVGVVPTS